MKRRSHLKGRLRAFATGVVLDHSLGDDRLGGLPFGRQRADDHRRDDLPDGAGVGVVRAQLGAHGRVEAPLEHRAEDRRLDVAPVHVRGSQQRLDLGGHERNRLDDLEQATVEPCDVLQHEIATGLHGLE